MTNIINDAVKIHYTEPKNINLQSPTNLILYENYFQFNSKIYKQNKGVPMKLPISNTVAKWKLRDLEKIT